MLNAKNRIGKKRFAELITGGAKIATEFFVVRYKKNLADLKQLQFSAVAPKKIAKKAVDRNYFRRRTYHAIREVIGKSSSGYYAAIFFAKSDLRSVSFFALKTDIKKAIDRITAVSN